MVTPRSSTQYTWTDPKVMSLVRLNPGFFFCTLTLMTPGQFGPISLVFPWRSILCLTRTMSCCGIPSVMHTTKGISASTASSMAAAAKGGGTYMTEAVAPVCALACNIKHRALYYWLSHNHWKMNSIL